MGRKCTSSAEKRRGELPPSLSLYSICTVCYFVQEGIFAKGSEKEKFLALGVDGKKRGTSSKINSPLELWAVELTFVVGRFS